MPLTVINQPRSLPRRARVQQQGGSDLSALLFNAVGRGFDTFDRRDLLEQQQQNFLEVLRQQAGQSETAAVAAENRRVTALQEQREFDKPFRDQLFESREQEIAARKTLDDLQRDAAARTSRAARLDEAGLSGEIAGAEAGRTEQGIRRQAERTATVGAAPIEALLQDFGAFLGGEGKTGKDSGVVAKRGRALGSRAEDVVGDLIGRLQNSQAGPLSRAEDLISAESLQGAFQGLRPTLGQRFVSPRGNLDLRNVAGTQADLLRDLLGTSLPEDIRAGAFDEDTRLKSMLQEALAPARAEQKSILNERRELSQIPLAPVGERTPFSDLPELFPSSDLSTPNETIETRDIFGPLNDPNAMGPITDDIGSELARRALLEARLIPEFA